MKILISAPYMIRERQKVEKMFNGYDVDITWGKVLERLEEEELLSIIENFDGLICGDDRLTQQVFDRAKKLKVIVKWGTGIDSIDSIAAKKRGISVFRTPNAFTEPVADSTLGVILYFSRGIGINNKILKNGGWDKPRGFALFERVVGIIGLGAVGTAVAKRLFPCGTTVLANDIVEKPPDLLNKYKIQMVSKEEIFERADIITLHCDLNTTSYHIINDKAFSKMINSPIIINTARGPLIEENSLIEALKGKVISGAGLDVFEDEPLPKNSPLREMDNVLLSAHNVNSSPACWEYVHKNSVNMLVKGLNIG